jgi:hypothetical protein
MAKASDPKPEPPREIAVKVLVEIATRKTAAQEIRITAAQTILEYY